MKKNIIFSCLLLFTTLFCFSSHDIITLKNGHSFKGEIKRIKKHKIKFIHQEKTYIIPTKDIANIQSNPSSPNDTTNSPCALGKFDGKNFSGKKGAYFVLGVVVGVFGPMAALSDKPHPLNNDLTLLKSENRDLFNNEEYLVCYQKEARKRHVIQALKGFIVQAVVFNGVMILMDKY